MTGGGGGGRRDKQSWGGIMDNGGQWCIDRNPRNPPPQNSSSRSEKMSNGSDRRSTRAPDDLQGG